MPLPRCNYIMVTSEDEPLLIAAAFAAERVFGSAAPAEAEASTGTDEAEGATEEAEGLSPEAEAFVQECKQLLSEGKVVACVAKLLALLPKLVESEQTSEEEPVTLLQVICVATQKVESEDLASLATTFVEGVTALSDEASATLVVKVRATAHRSTRLVHELRLHSWLVVRGLVLVAATAVATRVGACVCI